MASMGTECRRTEKTELCGTVFDAISSLSQKLPTFKTHCFIKKEQASAFQQMHTSPMQHHAVLQVDFSEKASIIEQDEIQSGHWVHKQVTLFSAVVWTGGRTVSFAVVSDRLSHDKYTAAVMLETIIDQIKTRMATTLTHIDIFSDGAAQHFKQKFMLTCMKKTKGLIINWHFFATSHGKVAVDGVGGTVKRLVHRAILSRKYLLKSAADYAACAKDLTKIQIIHVSDVEIE